MENYFESPFRGITLDKQVKSPNLVVGKYSYYSGYYHGHSFDDCALFLMTEPGVDKLIVGSFCSIGSGAAFVMAGNQGHRYDWVSSFPFHYMADIPGFGTAADAFAGAGDTIIGNDVWIGTEAIIMPGIRIGHGAVIGTRALVTKDVEPYAIVGGNPARVIRKRFSDEHIAMLLEMEWWDWPHDDLIAAMPLMTTSDIEALHNHWQTVIRP